MAGMGLTQFVRQLLRHQGGHPPPSPAAAESAESGGPPPEPTALSAPTTPSEDGFLDALVCDIENAQSDRAREEALRQQVVAGFDAYAQSEELAVCAAWVLAERNPTLEATPHQSRVLTVHAFRTAEGRPAALVLTPHGLRLTEGAGSAGCRPVRPAELPASLGGMEGLRTQVRSAVARARAGELEPTVAATARGDVLFTRGLTGLLAAGRDPLRDGLNQVFANRDAVARGAMLRGLVKAFLERTDVTPGDYLALLEELTHQVVNRTVRFQATRGAPLPTTNAGLSRSLFGHAQLPIYSTDLVAVMLALAAARWRFRDTLAGLKPSSEREALFDKPVHDALKRLHGALDPLTVSYVTFEPNGRVDPDARRVVARSNLAASRAGLSGFQYFFGGSLEAECQRLGIPVDGFPAR